MARTTSLQILFIRFRSVAWRAVFFDTTHPAFVPDPEGAETTETVKNAPRVRCAFCPKNSLKSARFSRNFAGMYLDSDLGSTFATAAKEYFCAGFTGTANEKTVCFCSFALFWLICSFHGPHYNLLLPKLKGGTFSWRILRHFVATPSHIPRGDMAHPRLTDKTALFYTSILCKGSQPQKALSNNRMVFY